MICWRKISIEKAPFFLCLNLHGRKRLWHHVMSSKKPAISTADGEINQDMKQAAAEILATGCTAALWFWGGFTLERFAESQLADAFHA
jgi:hypothetical protein